MKIPGLAADGTPQSTWQPGILATTNGVPNAIVPLNYAVGAGSANAEEAFAQLREAADRFWDMDSLLTTGSERYYAFGTGKFLAATPGDHFLLSLTATLVWDRHVDFELNTDPDDESLGEVTKDLLSNLDLILQRETAPGIWEDFYMSAGDLGNVEHIYLPELLGMTNYRLGVRGTEIAEPDIGEQYALVVAYTTMPEPGVVTLLLVGVVCIGRRPSRRRASQAAC